MKPSQMRMLRIASGIAVLLTTAAYGHLVHHFCSRHGWPSHSAAFFAALAGCVVVGVLSFVGAILLLWRGP
jgi:hypothetical protein